jgi:hypothetical protein
MKETPGANMEDARGEMKAMAEVIQLGNKSSDKNHPDILPFI